MKGMSETVSTASNAAGAWTNPLRDPRDLRLPRIAGPCSIVIFGVTGDLSRKKLLPAIYDLANRGLLPPSFGLTGFARRDWTEEHFKNFVRENVEAHCRTPFKESTWKQLTDGIRFVQGTFDDPAAFERLSNTVQELDRDRGTRGNHAFYMSVPPRAFPQVSRQLADCGLAKSDKGAWRRVIIEKPFGHDLASAKELDRVVSEVFDPSSVFRIDHYLGKETVQNMLALRFANAMYEPIWNNNYVDHVQITMAEDIGVAGRAGYYDGIGAARDIIQNHLLQLMALTAMEEPVSFSAADLTAEKTKVLSAVRLPKDLAAHTARGQYAAGWQGSHEVVGYLDEKGIDPASTTETYAAIRLDVDTRRWAGVPFYLRTGKRLGKRVTEIAVVFKRAPHLPFESTATKELGKPMLKANVIWSGKNDWEEVKLRNMRVLNFRKSVRMSFDTLIPAEGIFTGELRPYAALGDGWVKLDTDKNNKAVGDLERVNIGGKMFIKHHVEINMGDVAGRGPDVFICLVGNKLKYDGPIYIDNLTFYAAKR